MGNTSYVSVVYDEAIKPLTDYPFVFARYLQSRFDLRAGQYLLDAGCGRGEMLNAFASVGLECRGCDLEAPPVGTLACEIAELDFAIDRFPYETGTFDVVLAKSVLEHIDHPRNFLAEIYRVLKPGGMLILLTPEWHSQWRVFYEDPTHVHPYVCLGVERLLKLHGFADVSVEKFSHHPAIWRSSLWRGVAAFLRTFVSTPMARRLTDMTGVKYFRWAVELQVLAVAKKTS